MHVGMRGTIRLHDLDEPAQRGGVGHADPEHVTLTMPGPLGRRHGALDFRQRPPRSIQERHARQCELDTPAGPHEQRRPYKCLELPDLLAEGRLGDVQPARGPAEVQFLGDRDEVAQVPELHPHPDVLHIDDRHTIVLANTCGRRHFLPTPRTAPSPGASPQSPIPSPQSPSARPRTP